MCGIAGGMFWGGNVEPSEALRVVDVMTSRVGHRGPDGRGVHSSFNSDQPNEPFIVFGHTRLAILDVSSAGAQPMGGPDDKPWITFNGEIYNFNTLRDELQRTGVTFRSHSDTEVILRGYDAWGIDVISRLRGMHAFAIWDARQRRLLLTRDRVGIKPLYVYRGDGFMLFASEVRALLASGLVPRRLDADALWNYLGYQSIPAPRTLVHNVHALEPASWLTVSATGEMRSGAYWRMLDATAATLDVAPHEARALVADKLRDAVRGHLVSDVPVGAFLSGGIDSSAVVALMREAGVTPRTFSIGFEEQAFDESEHAALVAHTFGAEHTHVVLTGEELLAQLPDALTAMDQPTGDAVNTYVVSTAVRQRGITVALSGLGGDEVFGGYPSFSRLSKVGKAARWWGRAPQPVRELAAAAVRRIGDNSVSRWKTASIVESDGTTASIFPILRRLLSDEQRAELVSPALQHARTERDDPYDRLLADAFDRAPRATMFAHVSFAEARTYMHDVLLRDTDQMSMAHALEVRVPLLDHELIDLVMSLPDSVKTPTETPKRLLVDSLDGLLPDSIVHRPKQGFALPFAVWMRGPLRPLCERYLGEQGLAGRALFTPTVVEQMWRSFLAGGRDVTWSRLWTLVALGHWLDQHDLAWSA